MLLMDTSEQIVLQLTYLPKKISLKLRWRWVSECDWYRFGVYLPAKVANLFIMNSSE